MKTFTLYFFLLAFMKFGLSQATIADHSYFGQKTPGDSAVVFVHNQLPETDNIFGLSFSPLMDEAFLIVYNANSASVLHTTFSSSVWTKLDTSFLATQNIQTLAISPDGQLLTFSKLNPIEGSPNNTDIFYCKRSGSAWSVPQPFSNVINSEFREAGHAFTRDKTIYFASGRPTDDHKADIFMSKFQDGKYQTAAYVPNLSTPHDEDGIWIAPDESYAIVESWQDENKKDLYISFREPDGNWTKLKNMGDKVNTPNFEGAPKISPDGRYLFFWSDRDGKPQTYWMNIEFSIQQLKEE